MDFARDLRVLLLRADDGGCAFYRIREPARVASELYGVSTEVDTSLPVVAYANPDGSTDIHEITTDVDVIVFQRPLLRAFCDAIEFAQKRGIACVVELDDDLSVVDPRNGAYRELQPENLHYSNYMWVKRAAEMADWVTCSTPALAAKYARHGRYSVLRNCVPESVFKIEKTYEEPLRLGWTGSVSTHPNDLDVAGSHVGSLLAQTGAPLSIVGDGTLVREKLYVRDTTPVHVTGWVPLADYVQTTADNIDVGIVPLDLTPFNNAKSYLKGLEMAALGIPFVASPTAEYLHFFERFGGRIAKKPRDWQKHLRQLLTDRDLALEEGARLRGAVRGQTYEAHGSEWVRAWTNAREHRRTMKA